MISRRLASVSSDSSEGTVDSSSLSTPLSSMSSAMFGFLATLLSSSVDPRVPLLFFFAVFVMKPCNRVDRNKSSSLPEEKFSI